jgi:hypothetical protein
MIENQFWVNWNDGGWAEASPFVDRKVAIAATASNEDENEWAYSTPTAR